MYGAASFLQCKVGSFAGLRLVKAVPQDPCISGSVENVDKKLLGEEQAEFYPLHCE